jgi:hypothetical protein
LAGKGVLIGNQDAHAFCRHSSDTPGLKNILCDPQNALLYIKLAAIHYSLDETEKAFSTYQKAMAIDPEYLHSITNQNGK